MNKVMIVGFLAILAGCGSQVVDFPLPVASPAPAVDGGTDADATTDVVADAGTDSSYTYTEEWDSGTGSGGRCVCTCVTQ